MNGVNDYIDKGRLRVNVSSIDTEFPIENAVVRIVNSQTSEVIEELRTDSSGQTEEIELPAPPLEYSMEPSQTRPYSDYNILAFAPDFEPLGIDGVQILADTSALQNARLIEEERPDDVEVISIAPHTLWGDFLPKIPEPSVKELPQGSNLVVLPEPVVPEFMIVHLGVPQNNSAQNVWVPFTDYIKNVASSEIYATWPTETIRANVLAIVSFSLNRVFTEWYRGRGHNFTITNTTAYDQAFSYGRTIYKEISIVVDEIFATYITKPDINQPLLAQYCDGARSQCPGAMTQWGSKNLGDQGYSAINILKSFYGWDIFLRTATRVEGVPMSYPGSPLRLGDTGSNVGVIQGQLNAISSHYPLINRVRVDGVFGMETENAVVTFQQVFNLVPDGVVGYATWYEISRIYVAVTRIAELRG